MRLIKARGEDADDRRLTYHGSAGRRQVLKHGMRLDRHLVATELEGPGATRGHYEDRPAPRTGRP